MLKNESTAAITGEMNQEATIFIICCQLRLSAPTTEIPAPRSAPTTVWVPDIGIPNRELVKMNMKEQVQTENIIMF